METLVVYLEGGGTRNEEKLKRMRKQQQIEDLGMDSKAYIQKKLQEA